MDGRSAGQRGPWPQLTFLGSNQADVTTHGYDTGPYMNYAQEQGLEFCLQSVRVTAELACYATMPNEAHRSYYWDDTFRITIQSYICLLENYIPDW